MQLSVRIYTRLKHSTNLQTKYILGSVINNHIDALPTELDPQRMCIHATLFAHYTFMLCKSHTCSYIYVTRRCIHVSKNRLLSMYIR